MTLREFESQLETGTASLLFKSADSCVARALIHHTASEVNALFFFLWYNEGTFSRCILFSSSRFSYRTYALKDVICQILEYVTCSQQLETYYRFSTGQFISRHVLIPTVGNHLTNNYPSYLGRPGTMQDGTHVCF